jgi:hypothetical protein
MTSPESNQSVTAGRSIRDCMLEAIRNGLHAYQGVEYVRRAIHVPKVSDRFLLEAYSSAQRELLQESIALVRELGTELKGWELAKSGPKSERWPEVQKAESFLYRSTGSGL